MFIKKNSVINHQYSPNWDIYAQFLKIRKKRIEAIIKKQRIFLFSTEKVSLGKSFTILELLILEININIKKKVVKNFHLLS